MNETAPNPPAMFGWLSFVIGSAALIAAFVVFWAGPFAPQQAAGVSLGELAADVAKSAARSVTGQPQPEPEPVPRDIDDYLDVGVAVLGGLSIILASVGLIRHENRRPAIAGSLIGGFAIAFQLLTYTILLYAGVLLVMAVIYALRDAFGDIFGGLFDG